jgi:glycosyltransferase involved in cell wall biosynthesis
MTVTAESRLSIASRPALQLSRHIAPVRVLHVVPSLHSGGMERALVRLLSGFSEMRTAQQQAEAIHAVCVLQGGDVDLIGRCRSAGPIWVLGNGSSRLARRHTWRRLGQIISEFDPDVVHARTTAAWFDTTFALRQHPRVRLVLGFHGRTSLNSPGWLRRRINRWTCRRADTVLTVSCEAARMLEGEWEVPANKIRVIANGVDTFRFSPPQSRCGESPELPARRPGDHVVACVANLLPIKNIDTLLRNWRKVAMADPQAKLWLIGEGPMHQPLARLSETLRVADTVEFLGQRDDIPDLLRAADLFVLPSCYEGSSNATMEAMATGLPVIAFDVGGMSELVRTNHTGWLVPADEPDRLADVILGALIDRSARQRAGQAARRAVLAEHGLSDWVDRYTHLYLTLSEGGASACAE